MKSNLNTALARGLRIICAHAARPIELHAHTHKCIKCIFARQIFGSLQHNLCARKSRIARFPIKDNEPIWLTTEQNNAPIFACSLARAVSLNVPFHRPLIVVSIIYFSSCISFGWNQSRYCLQYVRINARSHSHLPKLLSLSHSQIRNK